jgi:hypothetical protein
MFQAEKLPAGVTYTKAPKVEKKKKKKKKSSKKKKPFFS